jgi:glutathione S-transferase
MTNAPMCHDFAAPSIGAKLEAGRGNHMRDMLLHWSPRSPYVRKVLIVAHETGLAERFEKVRTVVAAAQPNVELMKENPQSRLPTLRLADGTVIYDSVVICEYFDSLHSGAKLFPEKWPERLTALRRHALGDGMLDTMLMWRGEVLRPAASQSIKHMQAWKLKTNVSVDMLEGEAEALGRSPFSIGHVAIGVALGYIDFRFPELAWRRDHPRLAEWYAAFAARPSVRATEPVDEP